MLKYAPLRRLYDLAREQYPNLQHSENDFLECIKAELERDPLRTMTARTRLKGEGLDLALPSFAGLGDFYNGTSRYLVAKHVPKKEAIDWQIFTLQREQLLFKEPL